ncbi:MAG: hypothetical protein QM674_12815 [Burkholderiaceae bacterium]
MDHAQAQMAVRLSVAGGCELELVDGGKNLSRLVQHRVSRRRQASGLGPAVQQRGVELAFQPLQLPRGREVLLRVKAMGLNHRDVEIVLGSYPTAFPLPLVPLSDQAR